MESIEKILGYSFPEDFVSHYLIFNGGVPARAWWDSHDGCEPVEIAIMKPFKYNKQSSDNPVSLIDGCYHAMVERNVIPPNLIPFGNDWGGNYFCLNKNDGSIVFYATDSFDSDSSIELNHQKLQKKLAVSFKEFMAALVEESDLD